MDSSSITSGFKAIGDKMDTQLDKVFSNEYLLLAAALFVAIYASRNRMQLPDWLMGLFKNDIFRVLFLSLLLMINFKKSPHVAVIVAIVFLITMKYINDHEINEKVAAAESFRADIGNGHR